MAKLPFKFDATASYPEPARPGDEDMMHDAPVLDLARFLAGEPMRECCLNPGEAGFSKHEPEAH